MKIELADSQAKTKRLEIRLIEEDDSLSADEKAPKKSELTKMLHQIESDSAAPRSRMKIAQDQHDIAIQRVEAKPFIAAVSSAHQHSPRRLSKRDHW